MTYLDFSRPASNWDGDTFEEENENMAALAMQSSGGDEDEEEEDEDEDEAVVADEETPTEDAKVKKEKSEEEGTAEVDELAALDRLEKELKEDEFGGLGDLNEEEETI